MKLRSKKSLAFLLAIVMIVIFANFGTFSAFANDVEPSETTDSDQFINNYFGG